MSKSALLKEIVATYQKYGWTLRRVKLTNNTRREVLNTLLSFGASDLVEDFAVDALWFSRVSGEREAWELRLLSSSPYALFESFDKSTPEDEREKVRQTLEKRLQDLNLKPN